MALAGLFLLGQAVAAGAQDASADAVKAAFITKFGPFVQWPGPAKSTFAVCVLGHDGVAENLLRLRPSAAAPVAVRRLAQLDGGAGCDILYVARENGPSRAAALAATEGRPVLTVTDGAWGGAHGMVDFTLRDRRVRFLVDAQAASRSGLAINSKLLSLALAVRR